MIASRPVPANYLFLGGFRLTLAILVFIAHCDHVMLLRDHILWGGVGVWLFYAVSGYVILSAHEIFYRGKAGSFAVNRALRIYPLLWVCLALGCVQVLVTGGPELDHWGLRQFVLAVSVIGGFADGYAWAPLAPAATLSVEAQFYVASAVAVMLAERAGNRRGPVLYVLGLGFLAAYVVIEMTHSHYRFFGSLRWSPLFMLGASVFYAQRGRFRGAPLVLVLLSLAESIHLLLSLDSPSAYAPFALEPMRINSLLVVLALMALMVALIHVRLPRSLHDGDILAGDLTYPLYLVHVPLIALMDFAFGWSSGGGWGPFAAELAACLIAAWMLHRLVEQPFAALRRRWRGVAL